MRAADRHGIIDAARPTAMRVRFPIGKAWP
jgi:hypothetical protein